MNRNLGKMSVGAKYMPWEEYDGIVSRAGNMVLLTKVIGSPDWLLGDIWRGHGQPFGATACEILVRIGQRV